jgi:4-hydroxybenzoate polyprenyltransferase
MIVYLKLLRFQNLLFIAFIQFALHQAVLAPILQTFGFETSFLEMGYFYLLIAATTLIAAGGFVLNDYFDIKIDKINHPNQQIVGTSISRKISIILYQILTSLGIFIGLFLAFIAKSFTLTFIFIIIPGLLWFYSASYKRQFMIGNLVVAFIAALSVLIVAITQLAFLENIYGKLIFETPIPEQIYRWISGFACFAFICTWIREIIKDLEDEKGDREMECRTMAIVWGVKKTKLFLYGLITTTIIGLIISILFYVPFEGSLTFRYFLFGVTLPLCALVYLIFTAKNPIDYHQASTLSKVIMLIGILYCFLFYFLQAKTFGISLFNLFMIQQ